MHFQTDPYIKIRIHQLKCDGSETLFQISFKLLISTFFQHAEVIYNKFLLHTISKNFFNLQEHKQMLFTKLLRT